MLESAHRQLTHKKGTGTCSVQKKKVFLHDIVRGERQGNLKILFVKKKECHKCVLEPGIKSYDRKYFCQRQA